MTIEEIAASEGISVQWARERKAAILAKRVVDPPHDFVQLQIRRLSEAMLVAYSAMSNGNLHAVDHVLKIVRELDRYHGFSPFTGTSLDQTLRGLGVRTVVAIGLSLNLGVPGLCLEAVNLGYRVVVLTDAVAGMPAEYGDAVMANTIALLAARVTTDDLITAWRPASPP